MTFCIFTFAMCQHKVLFVVSRRLRGGSSMNWAHDIPDNLQHLFRNNYSAFRTALSDLYADRNLRLTNKHKLELLRQENSAASYAAEFQALVALLGLNDSAECLLFYRVLKSSIKNALATVRRASPLSALITW